MAHTLVTLLGAGPLDRVRWQRVGGDGEHETRYAPVAAAALMGGLSAAVVLLTEEARAAHWEPCRAELAALGIEPRPVPIPRGGTEEEIWEIFALVAEAMRGAGEVTADVTHGFRHLPFVVLASLTYLTALGEMKVRGIYYGAYEARRLGVAPLLDLGPLLSLGDWAHAARVLRESGTPRWLDSLLHREGAALVRQGGPVPALGTLRVPVQDLGRVLPAGLPLESGLAALRALTAVATLQAEPRVRPVARPVLDLLDRALSDLALAGTPVRRDSRWKTSVALAPDELARQLRLARRHLEWGHTHTALLLLREWIVNRCLLAAGHRDAWLDYERARLPMERALNGVAERRRHAAGARGDGGLLGRLWSEVTDRRNAFAHCGFRPEEVWDVGAKALAAVEACEAHQGDDNVWRTAPPGQRGRVLATPLGLSPGVLYTALRRLEPDETLVIASARSVSLVAEACRRAGWDPARVRSFRVEDPHACFGDLDRLLDEARPALLEAREVVVNVTGGTTAMQYLAERLADEAGRLGVPARRHACIDRRSAAEQEREPYVLGECLLLAGGAGAGPPTSGSPSGP